MKMNADLALPEMGGSMCCSPKCCSEPHKHYPIACLVFSGGEYPEIPESGTVVFRFNRKRKIEDTPAEGDSVCSVDLELLEMVSVDPEKKTPKSKASEAGDALDAIAKDVMGKKDEEY